MVRAVKEACLVGRCG